MANTEKTAYLLCDGEESPVRGLSHKTPIGHNVRIGRRNAEYGAFGWKVTYTDAKGETYEPKGYNLGPNVSPSRVREIFLNLQAAEQDRMRPFWMPSAFRVSGGAC